jgi:hypothetical protein
MSNLIDPDSFDRLAKLFVDDGTAATFEQAEAMLRTYRLQLIAGPAACNSETWQAALLTAVNVGVRAVHGGVFVTLADPDAPSLSPGAQAETLGEAVTLLGATITTTAEPDIPTIHFAHDGAADQLGFAPALHVVAGQWTAGVALEPPGTLATRPHILTAIVAAALAVSECFQWLRGYVVAGDRAFGISLWDPELNWLDPAAEGPPIQALPTGAWLLGLGHLGQATAWILSLLPYPPESGAQLVLQDDDKISRANRATSMFVSDPGVVGRRKTRLVAERLEHSFDTTLIERRYEGGTLRAPSDPDLLMAGVDNPQTRRRLDDTGFSVICDAGLGTGPEGYLGMQIRRLPGTRPSTEIWKREPKARALHDALPAYRQLEADTSDRCGVEQLAGRTVATAFVGVVAAGWQLGGVLRELHGGRRYDLIDLSLRQPHDVVALTSDNTRRLRLATIRAREPS